MLCAAAPVRRMPDDELTKERASRNAYALCQIRNGDRPRELGMVGEFHERNPAMADRRGVAEMTGEAMREVGVLIAAFGMLDKWLLGSGPSWQWTSAVLGTALFFFAVGATIERRRP